MFKETTELANQERDIQIEDVRKTTECFLKEMKEEIADLKQLREKHNNNTERITKTTEGISKQEEKKKKHQNLYVGKLETDSKENKKKTAEMENLRSSFGENPEINGLGFSRTCPINDPATKKQQCDEF
ncbi:Oidioi.mRNA.OKI2018_I69.chr2.g8384.t1.cds [Oikopleura dioica]|uniref:Oidioi.mRNA.OKI2018_I69.chr2.g8384.t1.cds n=1 Tax=Oikopleura dioica TaxID=34765 RepID=A0ABN7TDN2_OIKDI|nr:Oidioi.mRNA.OKI2018_I69.chr2.g8384.t1.cds [Oikopleura dioica]